MRVLVPALLALAVACSSPPPAGVTCPAGTSACGGNCAALQTDDLNCGSCGKACRSDEACGNGTCLPTSCMGTPCGAGQVCSSSVCVDKACTGVVCPNGQSCSQGACVCGGDGKKDCGGQCVDTRVDDANCGACGNACGAGTSCAAGACLARDCGASTCDPLSVCYQGACADRACVGVVCPGGKPCVLGACACPGGKVDCGARCADLMQDELDCGACGNACPAGAECVGGSCVASGCTAGKRLCSGACTDVLTDPDHCGECGNACGGGRNCVAGTCQCPPGLTWCNAACVNLQTDGLNCGGCGKSCNGGQCASGACSCPAGSSLCMGTCRYLQTDDLNCNTCGNACTGGRHCVNSLCACNAGTTFCNGACLPTANDNLNCGGCGVTCPSNSWCSGSMCLPAITCQSNFNTAPADCPMIPLDVARCGVRSLASTQAMNGMASTAVPFTMVVTSTPREELRVVGTETGAAGGNVTLRSSGGAFVAQGGYSSCCSSASITPVDVRTTGSVYACSQPTDVIVNVTVNGPASFGFNLEHWALSGKYNTGGPTPAMAADLAKDPTSLRVCDQVCGDVKTVCGDDRQSYRLVLPAGKAAVVDALFTGRSTGTAFDLLVTTAAGGALCSLISNGSVSLTPGSYRARFANNTNVDQTVLLQPVSRGGSLTWSMSIAVEP